MSIGTNGADTIIVGSSPGNSIGLGGPDTLTTTLGGHRALTSFQDGGAGNDSMTVTIVSEVTNGANVPATAFNTQTGGYGSDTIAATLVAIGPADTFAFNSVSDRGASANIEVSATAVRPSYSYTATARNVVETGSGADVISAHVASGSVASNVISSGGGNDTISASISEPAGASYGAFDALIDVSSGSGDDSVSATASMYKSSGYTRIQIDSGGGNDTVSVEASGGSGTSDDIIVQLFGGSNDDSLVAVADANSSYYSSATLFLDGGPGSDTLTASTAVGGDAAGAYVTLVGAGGHDLLTASSSVSGWVLEADAFHHVDGGAGNDTILSQVTFATYDDDGLVQTQLAGGFGKDEIKSSISIGYLEVDHSTHSISNNLSGGGGMDTLCADTGFYSVSGSGGYDPNATYNLFNNIDGGNGNDIMRSEFVAIDQGTHTLNDNIGFDRIAAIGGELALINSGAGNDTISSSAIDSVIDAGVGDDVIDADGAGTATVTGGEGVDTFIINPLADEGRTIITDWEASLDVLSFEGIVDSNSNGSIADEVNAEIVGSGTIGGDSWIEFSGGTTLEFSGFVPIGSASDILSYLDGDPSNQLMPGTDVDPPIC